MKRQALGTFLQTGRERAGFATQRDFAGRIGLSQQRVSAYERAETVLPVKFVKRYAEILGIDPGHLYVLVAEAEEEEASLARRDRDALMKRAAEFEGRVQRRLTGVENTLQALVGAIDQISEQLPQITEVLKRLDGEVRPLHERRD